MKNEEFCCAIKLHRNSSFFILSSSFKVESESDLNAEA